MEEGVIAYSSGTEPKAASQGAASPPVRARPIHHRSRYADIEEDQMPFIGRLGGNQRFVLDPTDPENAKLLKSAPDAAPFMTLKQQLNLQPFRSPGLWKRAITEGSGTLMLVYITGFAGLSPNAIPVPPSAQLGNFDNAAFLGPLVGSLINTIALVLFTISFGAITGAHLNPTITIATFCVRLCSLPRMVLYVAFQTGGAALAGLLLRASWGSRDFKCGGCYMFPEVVPVGEAFTIELFFTLTLLYLALGVGLDPRQKQVIPASLAPFLVGLTLGTLSLASGFTRYGYGGASMNPARCFGAFVGSGFQSYHWIHWVADILACIAHGLFYYLLPPGQLIIRDDEKDE